NLRCIVDDDIATVCTDLCAIGTAIGSIVGDVKNQQDWSDKQNDEKLFLAL
ncbi:hypothetical protein L917_14580, partial [Phytophthora nicotianae]